MDALPSSRDAIPVEHSLRRRAAGTQGQKARPRRPAGPSPTRHRNPVAEQDQLRRCRGSSRGSALRQAHRLGRRQPDPQCRAGAPRDTTPRRAASRRLRVIGPRHRDRFSLLAGSAPSTVLGRFRAHRAWLPLEPVGFTRRRRADTQLGVAGHVARSSTSSGCWAAPLVAAPAGRCSPTRSRDHSSRRDRDSHCLANVGNFFSPNIKPLAGRQHRLKRRQHAGLRLSRAPRGRAVSSASRRTARSSSARTMSSSNRGSSACCPCGGPGLYRAPPAGSPVASTVRFPQHVGTDARRSACDRSS
jgi:hypothetical protein